jgi:hypothetical protein
MCYPQTCKPDQLEAQIPALNMNMISRPNVRAATPGETRISANPLILAAMIKLCLTAPHLEAPEVRVFDAGKGAGWLLGKILFLAEARLTHVAPQAKNRKPVHTFPCLDR